MAHRWPIGPHLLPGLAMIVALTPLLAGCLTYRYREFDAVGDPRYENWRAVLFAEVNTRRPLQDETESGENDQYDISIRLSTFVPRPTTPSWTLFTRPPRWESLETDCHPLIEAGTLSYQAGTEPVRIPLGELDLAHDSPNQVIQRARSKVFIPREVQWINVRLAVAFTHKASGQVVRKVMGIRAVRREGRRIANIE